MNLYKILIILLIPAIFICSAQLYHPMSFTSDILADTVFCYDKNMDLKYKCINEFNDTTTICYNYDKNDKYKYRNELVTNHKGIPVEINCYDTLNLLVLRCLSVSIEPGLTFMVSQRYKVNNQLLYDTTYEYLQKFPFLNGIYLLDSNCEKSDCYKVNWNYSENSDGYYFERTTGSTFFQSIEYNRQALLIKRIEKNELSIVTEYFKYDEENRVIEWDRINSTLQSADTTKAFYKYRNVNAIKVYKTDKYQARITSNKSIYNHFNLLGKNLKKEHIKNIKFVTFKYNKK